MRSRKHNPEGSMSLRDHIYELRNRLGFALLFVAAGGIFGFIWFTTRLGPIPTLSDLMLGPYCQLPNTVRFEPTPGQCQLFQTQPLEAFLIRFKVGIAVGAVVTSPGWLYQLWAFITPGLYKNERKYALTFVGLASILFTIGALLAYFVVPAGLSVLVNFGGDTFITALAADRYLSFILIMLVIFGVSFLLPLAVVMLNRVGVLPYANLKKWRRGIIFGLCIFAAIATPADVVSMMVLWVAMIVLFEVAVQISRVHDKRKHKREVAAGLAGLSDDEASDIDLTPTPVETSDVDAGGDGGRRGRPDYTDTT